MMTPPALPRQTVLVVDDMPANLALLEDLLDPPYEVLLAGSAAEGLRLAQEVNPDLILLDVMMPEIDGYEVCRRLKADPATASIPVIFVTALRNPADEERGLDVGAIDFIVKPFRPSVVLKRVQNHLELKRYRDLLESQAVVDSLTGIANRRQFDQWLDREWRNAMRRKSMISLILGDVDFFKLFNDHYGHRQGDHCLRSVAQSLVGGARRPSELVARYGGEELACILPDTDEVGALRVADNLLERVRALDIPHERSSVADHVTLSLGVATMFPQQGQLCDELIQLADQQLYAAKAAGRNRVCPER